MVLFINNSNNNGPVYNNSNNNGPVYNNNSNDNGPVYGQLTSLGPPTALLVDALVARAIAMANTT